jgi:hypothetical protein
MVYLEINKKNYNKGHPSLIKQLNNFLSNKHNKSFVLIFMEGCGPCNATRPEWSKLKNILSIKNKNIGIFSIDKDIVSKVDKLKEADSFPTMRYITNSGNTVENYEDSNISEKNRTIDSFVEWIKVKTGEKNITKSENHSNTIKHHSNTIKHHSNTIKHKSQNGGTRKKRNISGGKWSSKYKKSINCNRPKGFSQKQYCKYGRKK